MPVLHIDGLRIAYEREGRGPPLVLLHGALSDARVWRAQIAALSDEFEVIAWDAPGAGRSSDPDEPFAMADWADRLRHLLGHLGTGPAHVAGLSWGGSLALEFYRRHPEAVLSLVLADTYAGWKGSLSPAACQARLEMALRTSRMSPAELAAHWLPGLLSSSTPADVREELTAVVADSHPAGMRLMAQSMAESDLRDVLPRIDVPTLLLWGERDERSPLSIAEEMLAAIPRARLAVLPAAGHDSNLEDPAGFNHLVREFCRSVGATRGEADHAPPPGPARA